MSGDIKQQPARPVREGFSRSDLDHLERRTREIGRQLFEAAPPEAPHVLQRRWWDDRIMEWSMRDEALRVQLFRFVDVLPMLHSGDEVVGHLNEYLGRVRESMPYAMRTALGVARRTPFTRKAVARAARLAAMDFARRFIAGTNTREVLDAARREREERRAFTLDILGEAVTSEVEAQGYFRQYADLIEGVAPTVNGWPEIPQIDRGAEGRLPRMNLSIKLSALDSQFDPLDARGALQRAGGRFRELLRIAGRHQAFINVDMESYDKKDLTLYLFEQVLEEDEFRDQTDVGIVIQCYLHDAAADLRRLRDWAARRGAPVWVRLVKGAYWDYETIHARSLGWPIPVFQQKWQSDANFEEQTRFVMQNCEHLRPALGSHNLRSLAHGMAVAEHLEIPPDGYEIQMLYGMADAAKRAIVEMGRRLRVYMPYGELIPGMAYLVRRLLENTSNESFLRAGVSGDVPREELLHNPVDVGRRTAPESADVEDTNVENNGQKRRFQHASPRESAMTETTTPFAWTFQNEPLIDFAREENRRRMQAALDEVRGQFGRNYPLVIDGEPVETIEHIESYDPSDTKTLVGRAGAATEEHVDRAVTAARKALPAWSGLGAERRGDYLRKAAEVMRRRHFELSAWEVYECGKGWREATADVCEAIDFCEFYSRQAEALAREHGVDVPGEENRFEYAPRGVAAVIAPWNFPLAILTGMTTASLATGNTVVMKPAEQASVVGAKLMEIFDEIGLPAGVANYLPGRGEVVGAALVEHPHTAIVAFTGSREVGLAINRRAAEVSASGIGYVKRVIAEMGGKNAIIVDADADLDEAVLGVVKSAFGYQGQKCSACSRAIVLESVYDTFLERLIEAARSLQVAPAEDPTSSIGPVVDEDSLAKIHQYIELGRQEGREVLSVEVENLARQGYFVGPHIYADVSPDSRLAQEEVFGPVLAVIKVKDLDEAIRVANEVEYGLTAGVFSRSPANLDRARKELMVGNLYINRNITGALVNRQPFGGWKMSGIGSKAGGRDYLLQFVLPRTITENTIRRGFAPPPEGEAAPGE